MKDNLNVLRNQSQCNYIVCCKSLCVPKKDLREGSTIALLLTHQISHIRLFILESVFKATD